MKHQQDFKRLNLQNYRWMILKSFGELAGEIAGIVLNGFLYGLGFLLALKLFI
jgi:hypothetical protein